ncbi:hypothetical protein [Oricola sp.]|uniref:hypothetical protein n=1 Tax=Oricola sp. TaxID=1979950 RepID=UPI003BAB22B2
MSASSEQPNEETGLSTAEAEIHQHELVGLLTRELALIAGEIEDLPIGYGDLSHEQIVAIQKIDFCRQRLMEVTKIMNNAFGSDAVSTLHDLEDILIDVGLEHTLDAFRRSS